MDSENEDFYNNGKYIIYKNIFIYVFRFKCEVRVAGYGYVGLGNSQSKKDAATNAANDFCNYLVRQGVMKQSDLPSLSVSLQFRFRFQNVNWMSVTKPRSF